MNRLFILLLLSFLWACQSKEELKREKQYLENCEILMSEKINIIRSHIQPSLADKFNTSIEDTNYTNHFYNAAQYYDAIHKLCISKDISFPCLISKDYFISNFLGISHSKPSPKEELLRKLKTINFTHQLVSKINKKDKTSYYDHYTAPNQDFEGMVILNKTHFKVGDTLEIYTQFYANKLLYQPNALEDIFCNDQKIDSNTYTSIATCKSKKPCHKTLEFQMRKFYGKDTLIKFYQDYIVYPKP